jgi:hypothetical protein
MANVTVTPGRVGKSEAVIRILREDFSEFPATDVHFSVQPPRSNVPSIDRAAVHQADGSWQVNGIEFGEPGNWTVRILVREQGGKPILLDAPIVIERTESR